MKIINNGVCAPIGFLAHGVHAGIRKNRTKNDLALISSTSRAAAAAVYTRNKVKGAPLTVTAAHLADGYASAIICNSGNANTCNADGIEIATAMSTATATQLGINPTDVVVASTGVIGEPLPLDPILTALPRLTGGLNENGSMQAALSIMTTDTRPKQIAVEFEIGGVTCRIGGIAKGSGMVHPDMATMLVFLTSDVAISPKMLKQALATDVTSTFNMLSIDGDTSTNDMAVVLANGQAGNTEITTAGPEFTEFMTALNTVTVHLCQQLAGDGEGATKLIECHVAGIATDNDAKAIARSVITSSLVKTAMFGADANWGRVLCAVGYAEADVDPGGISVSFRSNAGEILVCNNGAGVAFSEEKAKEILLEHDIDILISATDGNGSARAWGCDLTYEYVKINGYYRT